MRTASLQPVEGVPQVNTFEQVSRDGHEMSLSGEGRTISLNQQHLN